MEPIDSISWSLRGDRIADQQFVERGSGDVGEDLIWDAKTGKIVAKEPLSKSFYWHPKGKLVARTLVILDPAIDLPGTVDLQIYNLDTKANLHLRNTYFDAWSPDGKRFVVNNDDYTIRIWGQ